MAPENTPLTKKDLEKTLSGIFDDRRTIDEKTHRAHHEYIRDRIDDRCRQRECWGRIWTQVGGWAVVVALSAIGTAVWIGTKALIKKGGVG